MNFAKIAQAIRDHLKVENKNISLKELDKGIATEQEHPEITHHNNAIAAEIALDHLKERPNYYKLLAKYVEKEPDGSK